VVPKSPAEAAGLLAGDVIETIEGEPVAAPGAVVARVSTSGAGARLGFGIRRGTADRLVAVTLGAFPERDAIYRMTFIDRPAPPFDSLATAKGSVAPTLLAQRGQVVVIEFWAPWCRACRALIPHMNQWHAQYAARGVRVIGITAESVPRALSSANELGMDYPILADATGRTTRAYQASAIPAVFVIDRAGTVREVVVGYDGPRLAKLDALIQRLIAEGGPGELPTATR
jgi:peroxiredoxin